MYLAHDMELASQKMLQPGEALLIYAEASNRDVKSPARNSSGNSKMQSGSATYAAASAATNSC